MYFNPLFISNSSTGNTVDSAKEGKFNNSNYLFADIINVSNENHSLSEPSIEIDDKNKALFNTLKINDIQLAENPKAVDNQFLGDATKLSLFLSKVGEGEKTSDQTKLSKQNKNKSSDLAVTPEQITQLINLIDSGKKISLPLKNDGKSIFVEIQNFDSKSVNNTHSKKGIKLSNSENNGIQFTDLDFENIISDISSALKKSYSSNNFKMSEDKINAIVSKLETVFSKLESVQNNAFQPQKSILGSLSQSIEKEFQLSDSESSELKNVIVAQFVKLIKKASEEENPQVASVQTNNNFVSLENFSKELTLTPKENKFIRNLNASVLKVSELKEKIELNLAKSGNSNGLKSIYNKLQNYLDPDFVQSKLNRITDKLPIAEVAKELNLNTKEVQVLNTLTSTPEKVSLTDISKELKVEVSKPNVAPEIKSFVAKLDTYLAAKKVEVPSVTDLDKLPIAEVAKELNLNVKEVQLLNKLTLTLEKVSLTDISKELKVEVSKPNVAPELKSLVAKLDTCLATKKVEAPTTQNVDKLPIKEVAKELNLNVKEIQLLNKLTSTPEKVSLADLSKELKVEVSKPNVTPEIKSFVAKLDTYLATKKVEVPTTQNVEKLPIKEVAKELNLNVKEIQLLNKLTSTPEKVSLADLSKELKVEVSKPNVAPEIKSFVAKLDTYLATKKVEAPITSTVDKLPIKEVAKELNLNVKTVTKALNLTPAESKIVSEINVEKIDLQELKKSVKIDLLKNPGHTELKSFLNKIEKVESVSQPDNAKMAELNGKVVSNRKEDFTPKSKEVEKVKTEVKSVSVETKNTKVENSKSEYLFTLKNVKTPESVAIDKNLNVQKKNNELLKSSIYTSKESTELTKMKVIPINDDIRKGELRVSDESNKKEISRKINTGIVVNVSGENQKKSNFENSNTFQNEQNTSSKTIASPETIVNEHSNKSFNKEVQTYSNVENQKDILSQKTSTTEVKVNGSEVKLNESILPKASLVEHQIRNNIFNMDEKNVHRKVDIKNIKEEVSNFIQKGEKKSVEFLLNPETLGKVLVKLEVVNKIISASIKVDSETTQQILQNSLEGLKTSLNHNGVQLNSLNVSLANSEERNQRYFKQKRKNNNAAKMNVEGLNEKFSHKNLGYNKYDFIA